jgi:hypothetical protein
MSEDQEYRDEPLVPKWLWVALAIVVVVGIAMFLFGLGSDAASTGAS